MTAVDPTHSYPCSSCGAKLEFAAGTLSLKCPYCGAETAIPTASAVELAQATGKLDFLAYLRKQAGSEPEIERQTVKCPSCGAASQLPPNVTADRCPFCAAPLVAGSAYAHRSIRPRAVAPFAIKEPQARAAFKHWLEGLWFAPNALRQTARADNGLKGIYVPFWTYDADSTTPYTGERGIVYFEQERYVENGREQVRQVERVRWTAVSGEVSVQFKDVLVPASGSIPKHHADALAPWRLGELAAYRDDYVAGFTVEAYQTGLEPAFGLAREQMEPAIRQAICRDIGGDRQQILGMSPQFSAIAFQHILLPVWLAAYRYADRTYHFVVNGQTGSVCGERPWSAWKLAGAIAGAVILVVIVLMLRHGR